MAVTPEVTSKSIVNIAKVKITTKDTTPKVLTWKTADEADYAPDISEGEEKVLRVKNTIHATNRTEDIQYGSSITFKDNLFSMDLLAVIEGGTVTTTESVTSYNPPTVGVAVKKTAFDLDIYTEEKDVDGNVLNYIKFTFPNCKGKPIKYKFKDGEFIAPEYTVVSRPAKGTSPYSITSVATLD